MEFKLFLCESEKWKPIVSFDFDGVLHKSIIPGTIDPIDFYISDLVPHKAMHKQLHKEAEDHDIVIVSRNYGPTYMDHQRGNMINFNEWLLSKEPEIDEREIDALYDKAHIAVELVRDYYKETGQPSYLRNISTIANLASGAYGLYNSGENREIIDPTIEQRLIYWSKGKLNKDQLKRLPKRILKQYFPDLDMRYVRPGDTIRINVRRELAESKSHWEAVLRIGSTIAHEAKHEAEMREREDMPKMPTGPFSEPKAEMEAKRFINWAIQRKDAILRQYPELNV